MAENARTCMTTNDDVEWGEDIDNTEIDWRGGGSCDGRISPIEHARIFGLVVLATVAVFGGIAAWYFLLTWLKA